MEPNTKHAMITFTMRERAQEQYVDKYNARAKAEEYAKMAWPAFANPEASEPFYAFVRSLVHKYIRESPRSRLSCLEVGFGAGRTLYDMHTSGNAGHITGVEQSPAMLGLADEILVREGNVTIDGKTTAGKGLKEIKLRRGTIQSIPFRDNSFDFLVCINVLDRIKDTTKGISELVRVLRLSGILIIATPFDYESLTPENQRLSPEQLEHECIVRGCQLVDRQRIKLLKKLDNVTREFDEHIYIFKKMAKKVQVV